MVDACLAMPASDQQQRRKAASSRHQDDDYKRQKAVCEQYKKLDEHYALAEQHLEAALAVMERAKSLGTQCTRFTSTKLVPRGRKARRELQARRAATLLPLYCHFTRTSRPH